MSASFSERVQQLFTEASGLEPPARAAFLEGRCDGDEALHAEVASLLAAFSESATYFTHLSERLGFTAIYDDGFGLPDEDRIGAYRLVSLIGRGGMGAVYLAERADRQFEKRVALKVLPTGVGGAEAERRFLAERQILAQLVHPNIARLLDGGITERGTPYFVMDYVSGKPVDVYCDENELDVDGRLELFCRICEAVGYAHRNLVVHRDLKPANVLVEPSGEIKLVDFGIAKVLDPELARRDETRLGVHPMTPRYASPEMLRRETITTATDIYGLGILLYELLTGRHPCGSDSDLPEPELWRRICEEPPPPLDAAAVEEPDATARARRRRTTPERLRQRLSGDLDTILRKALKKDPQERYATVNAFVEDIRRHLENRPVLARPDSVWYRLWKFVGRNRLAVGAASIVLSAVVAAAGVSLWQARVALAEKERAEEVKDFIASIFRAADPYASQGRSLSAVELLQQATLAIDRRFETRPALRVELLNVVGASLMSLQDLATAEVVLAEAEREAARHLQPDHPEALRTQQLLVSADRWRGDTEEMRAKLETLLPALRADPEAYAAEIVLALKDRAHAALDEGSYDEAEAAALEAMAVAGDRLDPLDPEALGPVVVLALAYLSNDKSELALQTAERALQMGLRIHGGNARHPQVIDARVLYGRALGRIGQVGRAIEELELGVADAGEVFGPTSRQVGFYSQQLVDYQLERGHIQDALASSARAFEILGAVADPLSFTYGAGLNARGRCLLAARRGRDAARDLGAALDVATHLLGPAHAITRRTSVTHALALIYAGRIGEAEQALRAHLDAEPQADSLPAFALGMLMRLLGRHTEAMALQNQALSRIEAGFEANHFGVRRHVVTEIGLNQVELGELSGAVATLDRALALYRNGESRITPPQADALVGIGRARLGLGQSDQAIVSLEAADAFWRDFDPDNRWAGEAALWLGRAYEVLERSAEASAPLARAEAILSQSPLPSDSALARRAARP